MGLRRSENMMLKQNIRVPPVVPYVTSLRNGQEVVIDYLPEEQLSETYAMIREAVKDGDGFGINEFKTEKEFRTEIEGGYHFGVSHKDADDLIAVFIIAISKFYRGSTVADPFIIVKKSERRKGVGELCLRQAIACAVDLNFIGMYVDCFNNNKAMIKIIETVGGFTRCGFLPMGGEMQDKTFIGSIIFYKDLRREE